MLDLSRLRAILLSTKSPRRHALEAIRQIMNRFPEAAHDEFEGLLKDPTVGLRPKVFVLYWLREFGKFDDLVQAYAAPFREHMDHIVREIEDDEGEFDDSFSVEDFPDE